MDIFDTDRMLGSSEEDLLMNHVITGEYELLFLDTYLRETFGKSTEQKEE